MEDLIKRLEVDLQDVHHLEMQADVCSYEWRILGTIAEDIKRTIHDVQHLMAHKSKAI